MPPTCSKQSPPREPLGVIGLITPWNFPYAIPAWKIAPALAYGNCVVFKPAELVPVCAWQLADMLHRAGLPAGVFNLVMGIGRLVGQTIVEHGIHRRFLGALRQRMAALETAYVFAGRQTWMRVARRRRVRFDP
jgi:delta 1-pyrroline-5-carboxylate dehydrogenase